MKKPNLGISIFAAWLVMGCGLMASEGSARASSPPDACSTRSLYGDYGFSAEGVLLGVPNLPAEAQFRSSGVAHFDGKGGVSWLEHTVVNGSPLNVGWVSASGTYSVNSNCTGTAVVITPNSFVPLQFAFVIIKHGAETRWVLDSNAIVSVFTKLD